MNSHKIELVLHAKIRVYLRAFRPLRADDSNYYVVKVVGGIRMFYYNSLKIRSAEMYIEQAEVKAVAPPATSDTIMIYKFLNLP